MEGCKRTRPPTRRASLLVLALPGLSASACHPPVPTGTLAVVSFPQAAIFVDGRSAGVQSPTNSLRVRAGRHTVTLETAGLRFEPQTVAVRADRTTHLYFRARESAYETASTEVCTHGREDHCWNLIDHAMREGRRDEARQLGETYLRHHPHEGYALVVADLVTRLGGDARVPPEENPE